MKKVLIIGDGVNIDNYIKACILAGFDPSTTNVFVSPDDYDGLLIMGGEDVDPALYGEENIASKNVDRNLDDCEIKEIEAFVAADKPIFGTCRGIQIINVAFGGSLKQHIDGHHILENGMHKDIILSGSPYEAVFGSEIMVNSTHHQCVNRVAECMTVFAVSEDGIIEGIYCKEKKIIAVQWHPERIMDKGGDIVYGIFRDLME